MATACNGNSGKDRVFLSFSVSVIVISDSFLCPNRWITRRKCFEYKERCCLASICPFAIWCQSILTKGRSFSVPVCHQEHSQSKEGPLLARFLPQSRLSLMAQPKTVLDLLNQQALLIASNGKAWGDSDPSFQHCKRRKDFYRWRNRMNCCRSDSFNDSWI